MIFTIPLNTFTHLLIIIYNNYENNTIYIHTIKFTIKFSWWFAQYPNLVNCDLCLLFVDWI
jgi:hypothetical protein